MPSAKHADTLNLLQTPFPMRGALPRREPEMLALWEKTRLYDRLRDKAAGRRRFVLHDGPPYANGDLHMGHAVNKILKDIVVRGKTLAGYDAPYRPGWDCHGLPIEHQVEKAGGDRRDPRAFRRQCREFAESQIDIQRRGFIRMGVMGEWGNPYKTMDPTTEAGIIRALGGVFRQGLIIHRQKPVLWCADCESALAEAEVEYADRVSTAVDVAFAAADSGECCGRFGVSDNGMPVAAVIWTTTAWTLPANRAIVVHPDMEYILLERESDKKRFIVVNDSALLVTTMRRWHPGFEYTQNAEKAAEWFVMYHHKDGKETKIRYDKLGKVKGGKLRGLAFSHPFYSRLSPIITGEHVTADAGTGLVHTAPGHGEDDFNVGVAHGLPLDSPVDGRGVFVPDLPLFGGMPVRKKETIAAIVDVLKDNNALLAREDHAHSYPLCWRHKSPVLFRSAWQWFVAMDKPKADGEALRQQALAAIDQTRFYPAWGQSRLRAMIANRPDWCLSRQRFWNVPIPFFVHKQTGALHPQTTELLEKAAALVEKGGIEAWRETPAENLLGGEAADYEKIPDSLDVWFDSGVTHQAVMRWDGGDNQTRPDMYLEGADQHRGWFHSSLLTGVALHGIAPYRQILTHGFVVAGDGRKMSKSEGNAVSPAEIIDKHGADILRLWVAASDYAGEITVSDEIIARVVEIYRRVRNTMRFLLANLADFSPTADAIGADDMAEIDRYMLALAEDARQDIAALYARHEYHSATQKLHHFCAADLGGFYLDILKDRLYTCPANSPARRSAQTALRHVAEWLFKACAPILCFTADEAWRALFADDSESPLLHTWESPLPQPTDAAALREKWALLREERRRVSAVLERAREAGAIRGSLDAALRMPPAADPALAQALSSLGGELRHLFIVSSARVEAGAAATIAEKSPHKKCDRCWHHEDSADEDALCARCANAIAGGDVVRRFV